MTTEEWFAQLTATVDVLERTFGAMVVTHPDPAKAMNLLETMAKEATKSEDDSPATRAYKDGTTKAIARLAASIEFARKVNLAEGDGPKH
jgi:glycerol-3-phosphate O-acyltransferase